jgi:hypothetical protein
VGPRVAGVGYQVRCQYVFDFHGVAL